MKPTLRTMTCWTSRGTDSGALPASASFIVSPRSCRQPEVRRAARRVFEVSKFCYLELRLLSSVQIPYLYCVIVVQGCCHCHFYFFNFIKFAVARLKQDQ